MLIYPVYNLRRKIAAGLILSALVYVGSFSDYFPFLPLFLRNFISDYRVLALLSFPAVFWCGASLYLGSWKALRRGIISGELPISLAIILSWIIGSIYGFKPSLFLLNAVSFQPNFLFSALAPTLHLILVYVDRTINNRAGMSLRETTASVKNSLNQTSRLSVYLIVFSGLGFIAWGEFLDGGFNLSFQTALAALSVGAPLTLVLTAPLVIVRVLKPILEKGVKLRKAQTLELLGKVKAIVFAKRGVITEGRLKVEEVLAPRPKELMSLAAALCARNNHPLALGVNEYFQKKSLPLKFAREVKFYPGKGIVGAVEGKKVVLGNMGLMKQEGIVVGVLQREKHRLEEQGKTVLVVGVAHKSDRFNPKPGELLGMIVLSDPIRSGFSKVINRLAQLGVESWMLSGDSLKSAQAVGIKVGIGRENILSEVSPAEEEEALGRIAKQADIKASELAFVAVKREDHFDGGYIDISAKDERADICLPRPEFSELVWMIKIIREGAGRIKLNYRLVSIYHFIALPLALGALNFGSLRFALNPVEAVLIGTLWSILLILFITASQFKKIRQS